MLVNIDPGTVVAHLEFNPFRRQIATRRSLFGGRNTKINSDNYKDYSGRHSEKANGRLQIVSSPGEGTTVCVEIPYRADEFVKSDQQIDDGSVKNKQKHRSRRQ